MATISWDVGHLSTFLGVPEPTITTLIDTPTLELVRAVLDAAARKAHDFEELQSEKLRLEVELENAVRSSENKVHGLKVTVENSLKEAAEIREKLSSEGMSSPLPKKKKNDGY